jgi:ubiquinone/menaquinone biosynthesis C-methylase UbiE
MTRFDMLVKPVAPSRTFFHLTVLTVFSLLVSTPAGLLWSADSSGKACCVLADKRVEEPLRTIAEEYSFRTGSKISLQFLPVAEVDALVQEKKLQCDVVLDMGKKKGSTSPVGELPGATRVAWKHPTGEPVWAAVLTDHRNAAEFVRFVGGPTGHRLWSESKAGFTIVTGKTHAEAFEWVAENRVKHTYPMTAVRMLREIGGIREGICIDIGCGPGNLDIELAKRSKFKIIGLDIDADMKPLFEKRAREAGFQDRLSFVAGDAQDLPFENDFADVIVSRGTLTFIPDIGKCLREVDRVLKPTGVAFLGGRYIYTPQAHKISNEKLKKIVEECGVPGAKMIDQRGQWVKIVGPKAPEEAQEFQGGPHMLVNRFIADYAITEGKALLVCGSDGGMQQGMQQGFVESTDLEITALYPSEKVAAAAEKRIKEAKLAERITCKVGTLVELPFDEGSFDLVAGVGPILIWDHREKKMQEIYRVLRPGGAALVGGKYLYMPDFRKVSSETLRQAAANTGISSIRISDDMGQWVEIRKGIQDRELRIGQR